MNRLTWMTLLVAGLLLLAACGRGGITISVPDAPDVVSSVVGTPSEPVSRERITPYLIAGDDLSGMRTCEDVGLAFFGDPDHYRFTYGVEMKIDVVDGASAAWVPKPDGLVVSFDGSHLDFSSTFGIGAVIVYSVSLESANVYVYDPQATGDGGLYAPPTEEDDGLSDVWAYAFCWNDLEREDCAWQAEGAWSAGERYVPRGNWATFTAYPPDGPVALLAGRWHDAGSVTFGDADDGGMIDVTIALAAGFRFAPGGANVKLQDYDVRPPSRNPAPGRFDHRATATGEVFTLRVPANAYYGVHVEVERLACAGE